MQQQSLFSKRRGIKKTNNGTANAWKFLIFNSKEWRASRNRKSFVNHRRFITALAEEKRFISRDTSARWEIISSRPNNICPPNLLLLNFNSSIVVMRKHRHGGGSLLFFFHSLPLSLSLISPPPQFPLVTASVPPCYVTASGKCSSILTGTRLTAGKDK